MQEYYPMKQYLIHSLKIKAIKNIKIYKEIKKPFLKELY